MNNTKIVYDKMSDEQMKHIKEEYRQYKIERREQEQKENKRNNIFAICFIGLIVLYGAIAIAGIYIN